VLDFIRKFFRKVDVQKPETEVPIDVQTAPLSSDQLEVVSSIHVEFYPPQIIVGSAQSVGKQRDHNEDTLLTFHTIIADGETGIPLGLFVIADGMGGHMHGEIASGSAARALSEHLVKRLYPSLMGLDPEPQNDSLQEIMENAVKDAQQAVLKRAPGGGTTLTAALIIGEQVTLAHVGDSRAYFIYPDGRMQAMTLDHSLVRRLVDLGQLTEEQARVYPQKNVLYRALGQTEPFRPDIHTHLMPHPGYILICSDGLWGSVQDTEMFNIITSSPNPSISCNRLVDAANAAGGPDNISVILIHYLG
jgi:serine/threonine protein phosphatase PrpC